METRIFEDPIIPAFLETCRLPVQIIPHYNERTRLVEFEVSSETAGVIDAGISDFYNGVKIPAVQFVRNLKSLRNAIFHLKAGR